ncbi:MULTISPECIES: hypothetical protein [Streptomyces]|uniref:HEAT repeat domain-containing protein n=1 Tax=Streptomyces ehimensis TaxID=68195 RepID=A0ABV9BEH8_9ACTN
MEWAGRLVDRELRRAAGEALGALARSADYRDRADAGHALTAFAELPEAHGPLLELMLDPDDTYATRVTAGAVLRRRDRLDLPAVASALTVADPNHGDWIQTGSPGAENACCGTGPELDRQRTFRARAARKGRALDPRQGPPLVRPADRPLTTGLSGQEHALAVRRTVS